MTRRRQPPPPDWWLDLLIVTVVGIGLWLAWLLWGSVPLNIATVTTTTVPKLDWAASNIGPRVVAAEGAILRCAEDGNCTCERSVITTTTLAPQVALPCKPAKAVPCKKPTPAAVYQDRIAWLARHPWRQVEGSCNWTNGMQTILLHCGPAGTW